MWEQLLVALAGGIIGAGATLLFERWKVSRATLAEARFKVYGLLLDLSLTVFHMRNYDRHSDEIPYYLRADFKRLKWEITDVLRKCDTVPELDDIVRVLHSHEYATESERHDDLQELLDTLKKHVEPRFGESIRHVMERNRELMQEDFSEYVKRMAKTEVFDIIREKPCSYCAEKILIEARVCRYCGRDVPLLENRPALPPVQVE